MRHQAPLDIILKTGLVLGIDAGVIAGFYLLQSPISSPSSVVAAPPALDPAGIKAMVDTYCTECHNLDDYSGGLDLESFDFAQFANDPETGEKIIRKLSAGVMPPSDKERLDAESHAQLVSSLETILDVAWAENPHIAPLGVHRLYRREYANAIRERVFACRPEEAACAQQILSNLAERAYRRSATERDMELLMGFYEAGREQGDFETGIQQGVQLVLSDPAFIFRAEKLPENAVSGQSYAICELKLASPVIRSTATKI